MEQLEQKLLNREKWLYACFAAAFLLLAHAIVKAYENSVLTSALFFIEAKAGVFNWPMNAQELNDYYSQLSIVYVSPARLFIWMAVEVFALGSAAVLAFHSVFRKIALDKRLDLIFGYLLAGWAALLSLGAQDPLNMTGGYNVLVVVYLLALGLGYWWLRRKRERAEEVFP